LEVKPEGVVEELQTLLLVRFEGLQERREKVGVSAAMPAFTACI